MTVDNRQLPKKSHKEQESSATINQVLKSYGLLKY